MSKVILVSGNDTGIGKTSASAFLASKLSQTCECVYVKPVETGVTDPQDAKLVSTAANAVKIFTLTTFRQALAPVESAQLEGKEIDFLELIEQTRTKLKSEDYLLVEGAGGLATPLDRDGRDWLDFAETLRADFLVLVVENRLGLLNQVRLLSARLKDSSIPFGLWLNQIVPQDPVLLDANLRALEREPLPIWAMQSDGQQSPSMTNFPWEIPE